LTAATLVIGLVRRAVGGIKIFYACREQAGQLAVETRGPQAKKRFATKGITSARRICRRSFVPIADKEFAGRSAFVRTELRFLKEKKTN